MNAYQKANSVEKMLNNPVNKITCVGALGQSLYPAALSLPNGFINKEASDGIYT